ncbi:hypothetical protein ABKV19_025885 [Rosa sericea]
MAKKMVATVSPLRWLEIVTEERVSSRSTLSRGVLVSFLFNTQPPPPSPNGTEPSSSSFSASDQNPSKNEEEREVGCEGLGLKDGGCSRVQGLRFRDELEQLRKKSGRPLTKHFSSLVKWTRAASAKAPQSDGNVVQFESGYLVETVMEGTDIGVVPFKIRISEDGELFAVDSVNSNIVRITPPLSQCMQKYLLAVDTFTSKYLLSSLCFFYPFSTLSALSYSGLLFLSIGEVISLSSMRDLTKVPLIKRQVTSSGS